MEPAKSRDYERQSDVTGNAKRMSDAYDPNLGVKSPTPLSCKITLPMRTVKISIEKRG
jgi:hypothetical protein